MPLELEPGGSSSVSVSAKVANGAKGRKKNRPKVEKEREREEREEKVRQEERTKQREESGQTIEDWNREKGNTAKQEKIEEGKRVGTLLIHGTAYIFPQRGHNNPLYR